MKHGIKEIPEQYIENHWRKNLISRHYHFGRHVFDTGDNEINRSVNQTYYNFEACLEYVRKNKDKMDFFVKKTESMLKEYENDPANELNKGSGKKNRFQSATKITYKNSNKQTRRCSGCGERAPHNLHTSLIKLAPE
uniref:Protein FAR1-RELATED SEQUENCE n=1 Tax=Lactuca sativa TaxID=4236 RepID=A0A9R1XDU3_LACSA|nr:hypothetical protein LSAT_V11C400214470 [Lactuca sativa]